jgi:ELWxxDGT repeat protein
VLGGEMLYAATSIRKKYQLFASDGTVTGTRQVIELGTNTRFHPGNHVRMGRHVYFDAWSEGVGDELWRTDGTESGTTLVRDIVPGKRGSSPDDFMFVGDKLFFEVDHDLWVSDGSEQGTVALTH